MAHHKQVRFPIKRADYPAAAVVIHGGIPFAALEILGTISPILCQNIGLFIFLPNALPNFRPERMRQLHPSVAGKNISHVKTPAIDGVGRFQPLFQYGILPPIDDFPQGIGCVIQGWHGFQIPPAMIAVVRFKEIVAPLHRVRIVVGAFRFLKIQSIPVEPAVSGAGVIDGNIQNQLHSVFVKRFGQIRQSLISAKMRIYMEIIQAVIFVAGLGIENGIQIKSGDAQLFQIRDFLLNSL